MGTSGYKSNVTGFGIGTNFEYLNDLNLGISHMTGLRNPTLYELFGTDNFGYSGNRNLKPEKSNTYEIYSNYYINENIDFLIRAFKSNIKNNIEYINNQYQNDDDNVDLNQSGINNEINFKSQNHSIKLFSSFLSTKKENKSDQLRRPEKNYGLNFSKIVQEKLTKGPDINAPSTFHKLLVSKTFVFAISVKNENGV